MAPSSAPAITRSDLESFLTPLFTSLMAEYDVPGAVATVVLGEEVLYLEGFGVTDREAQTPVDPRTSVYRVASVSKAVTATIAMQAVDDGLLELDTDINRYLKSYQVPNSFSEPVTMRHLLTHTGGFDDRSAGRRTMDPSEMEPLADYLAKYMPARIFPPGQVLYYTNDQMTLASLVLEEASGEPFETFAKSRFFDKLGMSRTSYIRDSEPEGLVKGYTARRGGARILSESVSTPIRR